MKSKQELKKVFEKGDKPRQEDFWEWQDSYWHKEENIPKEKIEGIPPNLATVDIISETQNVEGTVNTKEQVDEKIASAINNLKNNVPETYDTLKEIADWISNDETAEAAILQTIQNEAAVRANADNLKLDKPTITSNPASYPYVVGENGNGGSARLPAGDLGKNFFNSDLSNTIARTHTMNAGVTVNTLGNPHTLAGLPNKNTDITNFRKVRVQNTSGLDAVVDSKNILVDMPNLLTDAEKTAWKTAMNGGWSTSTMSVSSILPTFIDKSKNYNTYITLNGANLNLNPSSFSVEILDSAGSILIATIPNSQVQLNTVGTSITFFYNFNSFALGNYKIKFWNGVTNYVTPLTISVVDNTTSIDLSTLTWQVQQVEAGKLATSTNSITGNLNSNSILVTAPFLASLLPISNLTLNDDFVIACTFLGLGGNGSNNTINSAFGISTSSVINGIVNSISYGVNVRQYQSKASAAIVGGNGQTAPLNTTQNTSFAFDLIISKSGNVLNIAILNPNSGVPAISTVTITPSSQPISLALFSECAGNQSYTISFSIVNIIKIS